MTSVSQSCVLPTLEEFVGRLVDSQTDLSGLGVGVSVAAADVVAASLAFVGLEAFILATVLDGDTLTELLVELQQDVQTRNDTTTRIRTETQRCIDPAVGDNFGKGSRTVESLQDLWNRNGSNAIETMRMRTGNSSFPATTPAQSSALRNWRRTMANLFNCIEMLIEGGIYCQGERGQRCRVPAIVEVCILRAELGED